MDNGPDVSVVVAAYNAEKTIERALLSAVSQRVRKEILVVDDASTDATPDLVSRLASAHPDIRLIRLAQNSGPGAARNRAIKEARGEFVAILDTDDAFKVGRLAHLIDTARVEQLDFVADNQILYDAVAQKEGRLGFKPVWYQRRIDVESFFRNDVIEKVEFGYGNLKPVIRKDFLDRAGVAYDPALRYGEDFKFSAECLFCGARAMVSSMPLYVYTTRQGEFSGAFNPHSKSVSRFDILIQASDDLAAKYRDAITPAIAAAMRERREQLWVIHLANLAREFRKDRRFAQYGRFVLANPSLLMLLLRRTAGRAKRSLSGAA